MEHHHTKVLIILKKRHDYNSDKHYHIGLSTGLYNSAMFIHDMLEKLNIHTKLVVVNDNNDIDREVTQFKPTHVIIEALWVVPTKFNVLCKLHPKVKWIIRLHSELPFLANEGIAINWIGEYLKFHNVMVAVNSLPMLKELKMFAKDKSHWHNKSHEEKIIYLPNYYPQIFLSKKFDYTKNHIDISCFGSIRPMKNHLTQAFAAIDFADTIGKKLKFHINCGRFEQRGEPVLNNLIALFDNVAPKGHELIMHEWMPRLDFLALCRQMDIGMQVSFSETFNIVAADLISVGTPVVGSHEIPWLNRWFAADPTSTSNIYSKLWLTYFLPLINLKINQKNLNKYSQKSAQIWESYFKHK